MEHSKRSGKLAFLSILALGGQAQDVISRTGRTKPVVDVDDGHSTATAVQHTEERSEPAKTRSVANAGRQCDNRLITNPATTPGSAPSIPAATIKTPHERRRLVSASNRCRPATPTSTIRSTRQPKDSRETAASSAAGKSAVPAQTIPTFQRSARMAAAPTVMHRARS